MRFQAQKPHHIWQADAKAPFRVRFVDGTQRKVRILTILDDATRFVLRALVVVSESTRAAVAVFRQAASRYGLPEKFYADRGSCYDSDVFRKGLAVLGVHRINTRSRNAPAHGKIEAYHRVLQRWFIRELPHQAVLDPKHLQDLLDAVIDQIYHEHIHKELKKTPKETFTETISERLVSLDRLREAFLIEKELSPDKKTRTVRVKGELFLVPEKYMTRRKVKIAVDPEEPGRPYLVVKPGLLLELERAVRKAGRSDDKPAKTDARDEPAGSLSPILERYRGRTLPRAKAGFGLPEIYQAFSYALGREVPATEADASEILDWLKVSGPFDPRIFQAALEKTVRRLGAGRPLVQIIRALDRRIRQSLREKEDS